MNQFMFYAKSLHSILNSVYAKHKLPFTLKIKFNQTIQRFSGPNIRFTFGNFMELTSQNVFNVKSN